MRFSRQRPLAGIDVGSRTLKGVTLKFTKGRVGLDNYFFQDLHEGAESLPDNQRMSDVLKALVEVRGFRGARAAAAVDDRRLDTFDLELPIIPEDEIAAAIAHEVEGLLPYPIEQACLDHVRIDRADGGEPTMKVKVYCFPKGEALQIHRLLQNVGLEPRFLESSMLANIAALDFNGYLDEGSSVIMDLGESKTVLGLVSEKKLKLMHTVLGMGGVVQALMDQLQVPLQQADEWKKKFWVEGSGLEAETTQIIENEFSQLFQKIERSVEYFRANSKGSPIKKIFLVGGGTVMPQIDAAMNSYFRIDVIIPNPFERIEIIGKDTDVKDPILSLAPFMTTAVGLSLRGVDGHR